MDDAKTLLLREVCRQHAQSALGGILSFVLNDEALDTMSLQETRESLIWMMQMFQTIFAEETDAWIEKIKQ